MEVLVLHHLWKEVPYPKREMYPIFEECDEGLIMTTKDFVDYPESEEEEYECEYLKFPYDSLDDEDDEDIIVISNGGELNMETRKLKLGQWASQYYPPPPPSKPPRLPQGSTTTAVAAALRKSSGHHRSSPTGGGTNDSGSSVTLRGHLVTENSRLPVPGSKSTSRAPANSSHKISPTTISSTTPSPSPSSSSESCTTPTNELGERGSPAGASNSSGSLGGANHRHHHSKQSSSNRAHRSISSSQPFESNAGQIEAGILLSPQLKRTSRFSTNKPIHRSDSLQSFPKSPRQGFIKKVPSVASRIMQFEGGGAHLFPESSSHSSPSAGNLQVEVVNGSVSNSTAGRKESVEEKVTVDQRQDHSTTTVATKRSSIEEQVDHQSSTDHHQQRINQSSPTSSMEELSLYNQTNDMHQEIQRPARPEAVVPPHKHTAAIPPFTSGHAHSHHPRVHSVQPRIGLTYTKPPTQPVATAFSGIPVPYAPPSAKHSYVPLKPSASNQQPLGLVTATLAMAHNAAANGDVMTLRKLLSSGDVDALSRDEYGSTLIHTAATYGQLASLQLLSKDLSLSALLLADNNFLTPPLLAIQGGHVECLKYLVEELGTPLTVPEAGGETLLHHAAFHGQVKCLEYLIHRAKMSSKPVAFVDESGVTPAHFAAQRGHLDCLRLMINYGFDVTASDQENMKPADWADATGQHSCTQYLIMIELCWQLSRDVSMLTRDLEMLRQENNQLHELLDLRDQEHHSTIAKLHQQHQEKIHKVHEKYAGITVSLLRGEDTSSSVTAGSSQTNKDSSSVHKPTNLRVNGNKSNEGKEKKRVKIIPEPLTIEEKPSTSPHEVLKRQLSNAEQRLNASREMRKLHPVMATRSFSPLSPIVKRMNSLEKEEEEKDGTAAAAATANDNIARSNVSFSFEAVLPKEGGASAREHAHNPELPSSHKSPQDTGATRSLQQDGGATRLPSMQPQDNITSRIPSRKSPPQDLGAVSRSQRSPPQDSAARSIRSPSQDNISRSLRSPPRDIAPTRSQRSPPQDIGAVSRLQRSPPQDSGAVSRLQRSPPQDSSAVSRLPSMQRSQPQDLSRLREPTQEDLQFLSHHAAAINRHSQSRGDREPSVEMTNETAAKVQRSPQHKSHTNKGGTSVGYPHYSGQQYSGYPSSQYKHKSRSSADPGSHSMMAKSQSHTSQNGPQPSAKTQSHSRLQAPSSHRSYGKDGRGGGGGESHPLSVTHTSPQHVRYN